MRYKKEKSQYQKIIDSYTRDAKKAISALDEWHRERLKWAFAKSFAESRFWRW